MKEDHIRIINDRDLPDNPTVEWNGDTIGNYIKEAMARHGVKTVRSS